jgi:hypothetical protein
MESRSELRDRHRLGPVVDVEKRVAMPLLVVRQAPGALELVIQRRVGEGSRVRNLDVEGHRVLDKVIEGVEHGRRVTVQPEREAGVDANAV